MIEADINYQQTWEQYGEELKKNFHCSLKKFCYRMHISYNGNCDEVQSYCGGV